MHCFQVLETIQERIWLPNQVAGEYLTLYHSKIAEPLKTYSNLLELFRRLPQEIKVVQEHPFIEYDEISKLAEECSKKLVEMAEAHAQKFLQHPNVDNAFREQSKKVHMRIADLFENKVGKPFDLSIKEAKEKLIGERYDKKIPPGFLDKNKANSNKYGDGLLWLQLLDHLQSLQDPKPSSVILVTEEEDRDWWWVETINSSTSKVGPHYKLVEEIREKANLPFFMYSGPQFLSNISRIYGLERDPKVEEEIRMVSEKETRRFAITPRDKGLAVRFTKKLSIGQKLKRARQLLVAQADDAGVFFDESEVPGIEYLCGLLHQEGRMSKPFAEVVATFLVVADDIYNNKESTIEQLEIALENTESALALLEGPKSEDRS